MLRNGLFDPRSARAPIRRRGANLSSAARPRGDTRSAEGASRKTFQKAVLLGAFWAALRHGRLAPPAPDEVEVGIPNRNAL